MTITDAQRLAIAQFCGWEFRQCKHTSGDCEWLKEGKPCGWFALIGPRGNVVEWSSDGTDDLGDSVIRYETHPELVGPMLLAIQGAVKSKAVSIASQPGKWTALVAGGHGVGFTPNEALCKLILNIIESGAKPQGGER